jgi:hypothetical protein
MNRVGLIGCFLAPALHFSLALSKPSIPTGIIPGGEVSISDVQATHDGQSISVSGTGFEVFPRQTCGHAEIAFLDANGRILYRKNVEYRTSYSQSPRKGFESRIVSFYVNVPVSAAVASVSVRHQSTGGCGHSWSLQNSLDWVINKIFSTHR